MKDISLEEQNIKLKSYCINNNMQSFALRNEETEVRAHLAEPCSPQVDATPRMLRVTPRGRQPSWGWVVGLQLGTQGAGRAGRVA